MASDQQLAPVHGATAEKQTKGRGALQKAYPKTAEGLQRLDADIKERGAKELGARYAVTHHAVLQHRKRMRNGLSVVVSAALEPERAALKTGQKISEELIAWEKTYEYLDQLGRGSDRVVFTLFPPTQDEPCIHIPLHVRRSQEEMRPLLGEVRRGLRRNPGHSLGVVVNPAKPQPEGWGRAPEEKNKRGKPKAWGASNAHISGAIAIFGECDGSLSLEKQELLPEKVGLPQPTFTVATTGRSLHHYWLVEGEPLKPHEFRTLQRRVARHLNKVEEAGADSSICNPARVMRVPGSIHPKSGGRVHIHSKGGPVYTAERLLELIPPLLEEVAAPQGQLGENGCDGWFGRMTPTEQRGMAVSMVRQLPLRTERGKSLYDPSLSALAGMVHHFGTEEAIAICLEAKWTDSKFWPMEEIARSIGAHGDEAAGIGSLIHWAKESGWKHPNEALDAEAEELVKLIGNTENGIPLRDALDAQDREALQLRFLDLRASMVASLDLRDVLPQQLAEALIQAAETMPVDSVALLGPLLCGVAAIAGTRVEVFVKENWKEPLVLWMANVLRPGAMKSPIVSIIAQPMNRMQAEWLKDWENLIREGGEFVAADPNDPGQPPAVDPPRRIVVSDCTYEKAVELMAQKNIPGMLSLQDELSGFFAAFQKNPTARSGWLSLWSGGAVSLDRKTVKSAYASKTATSLFGNLQPDKLANLLAEEWGQQSEGGDGLWSRFLWCRPRETQFRWQRNGFDVTNQVQELLESVEQELQGFRLRVRVDLEVMDEYVGPLFEQWALEGMSTNAARSAFLSKLRGYTIRFMGVLCIIELAVRNGKGWRSWLDIGRDVEEFQFDYMIDRETMLRAVVLARYYLAQWDSLQPEVTPSENDGPPQWIAKFLRKVKDNNLAKVTTRQIVSWKLDKAISTSINALVAFRELEEKWGHGVVRQGKRKDQYWWEPSTAELLNC